MTPLDAQVSVTVSPVIGQLFTARSVRCIRSHFFDLCAPQTLGHLSGKFDPEDRMPVSSRHLTGCSLLPSMACSESNCMGVAGHVVDEHICVSKGATASADLL